MRSKEDLKKLKIDFWTAYGKYMTRHASMRGPKISWLNYKTGIRHIYFRQDVDQQGARVSIDIQHGSTSLREVYFDQFWELETLLHSTSGSNWTWERNFHLPSGQEISRISITLPGTNIEKHEDWPLIFTFFERNMLALDEIWVNALDIFKDLES
jgi:hypothetical protein